MLEIFYCFYTIDYRSCWAGSKAADIADKYYLLFFFDYISIVSCPFKAIIQASKCFFDNMIVTFKDWNMLYTGKYQYKLLFDLENQMFRLASAAIQETWFIVMYPIVALLVKLLSIQHKHLKKQA